MEMPDKYFKEMIADWRGAGKSIGNNMPTEVWYAKNSHNLKFNEKTRDRLDNMFLKI